MSKRSLYFGYICIDFFLISKKNDEMREKSVFYYIFARIIHFLWTYGKSKIYMSNYE